MRLRFSPYAKYVCFWFCVAFVAFGQRRCKVWRCRVFDVAGEGMTTRSKTCGANTPVFKTKKIFKKKKIKILCLV